MRFRRDCPGQLKSFWRVMVGNGAWKEAGVFQQFNNWPTLLYGCFQLHCASGLKCQITFPLENIILKKKTLLID